MFGQTMALSLSNVYVQEFFLRWKQGVQPWADFADTKKFTVPKALPLVGRRVLKNIDRFKSNYTFVALCIIAFSILTSPMLLLAIGFVVGASYIIVARSQEHKVVLLGRELSLQQQLYGVVGVSLWLLWLFGIFSVVFWIIGLLFVLVTSHASFYVTDDEFRQADLVTV